MNNDYTLRYPIGKFECPEIITEVHVHSWIKDIEEFPQKVKALTEFLSDKEKNWFYRPDGWSIKQVVHHCADSHSYSLTRFKLILTEDCPTVRPYFEARWAELIDSLDDDLSHTYLLLEGLHYRWALLLKNLSETDYKREFYHPEAEKTFTLEENIGIYAWHCRHHLAHIEQALKSKGKHGSINQNE